MVIIESESRGVKVSANFDSAMGGIIALTQVTDSLKLCDGHPGRLWSLWDMLKGLWHLVECRELIEEERKRLSKFDAMTRLEPSERQTLQGRVYRWRQLVDDAAFGHASRQAIKVEQGVHRYTYGDAVRELRELADELKADFGERHVYVLPAERQKLYDSGFGARIDAAFPKASQEAREAGSCLALGRSTASVFHHMRAVEYALRAIAVGVGVPSNPTLPFDYQEWNGLIDQVQKYWKNSVDAWQKSAEQINARQFFNRIVPDLYLFKDDVRNVTMHTRRSFSPEAAIDVRNRVESWFGVVADKTTEDCAAAGLLDRSLFRA